MFRFEACIPCEHSPDESGMNNPESGCGGRGDAGPLHHVDTDALNAYLDDELTFEERRQIDEHLATCADCRQELAELSAVRDLLRALPQFDPHTSFQVGTEHERRKTAEPTTILRLLPLIRTLSVAAVLAFLIVGGVVVAERIGLDGDSGAGRDRAALAPAPTSIVVANERGTGSDSESFVPTEEAPTAQHRRSALPSTSGNSSSPIDRGESASTNEGSPGNAAGQTGADLAQGVATAEGLTSTPQSKIDQGAPLASESVDNSSDTRGKPWVMTTIGLGLLAVILLGLWILLTRMSKQRRIE